MRLLSAVLLLAAAPALARAAQAGEPITAVKRSGPVTTDGRLDEAAWAAAPVFDGFVQNFPHQGSPPSEVTEVRVLYDDRDLWVGIIGRDREPGRILRPLGRRDSTPYSDSFGIIVDPMRDGRLGYYFEVTAAGVLSDALVFDNDQSSVAWDAVWEGQVASLPDGWSAEVRIPLSVMRFTDAPVQTWGFAVKRIIGRSHEEALTVLIPRGSRGQIARLGPLVGLADMQPAPDLQLTPYLAGRYVLRPADPEDDTTPHAPRLADPVAEFGFDLRASLGRSMALQATVNPDFGQVEADQIIQNLSNFEAFFPEKRPFFLQGMDLFQPTPMGHHDSPQRLFYSRRIGNAAPILAAAKVTGRVGDEVEIGLLESVVTGEGWPSSATVEDPPRDVRFSWSQPFRVGPESALPEQKPASQNFLVGVAKWQPAPNRNFGATVASALPLGELCSEADVAEDDGQPRCTARGGNAAALDWAVRTSDREWFFMGQATASQAQGGPPSRTLADGTVLARGDVGAGGFVGIGRDGGRGLRGEYHGNFQSPTLDVNATGFQRTQNEWFNRLFLNWVEPQGGGPFHHWDVNLGGELAYTTDARHLNRWGQVWLNGEFQLRSFQWIGVVVASDLEAWDVREISQSGHAQRRPTSDWANVWFETDASKPLLVNVGAGVFRTRAAGPLAARTGFGVSSHLRIRPHPRFETRLEVSYEENGWRARYVDDDASSHVFADLSAPLFSATLRQQIVLTPRLTLQAYAQLFTSYGQYGTFYTAPITDSRVDFSDLVVQPGRPPTLDDPNFRDVGLNVNVVGRWEYRAGSTLFLVYTRSQTELATDQGGAPGTLHPQQLSAGPTTDTFMVKWTYFWNG